MARSPGILACFADCGHSDCLGRCHVGSPHFIHRKNGGIYIAFWRPLKWGGLNEPGVKIRWLRKILGDFGIFLAKPPNEAILDLPDPQNRTRDHVSIPKGPNISSYGPFLSHLEQISSQIKPNPTRPTWEEPGRNMRNLVMDFVFFSNGDP